MHSPTIFCLAFSNLHTLSIWVFGLTISIRNNYPPDKVTSLHKKRIYYGKFLRDILKLVHWSYQVLVSFIIKSRDKQAGVGAGGEGGKVMRLEITLEMKHQLHQLHHYN